MPSRTSNTDPHPFRPPVSGRSSWTGEVVLGSCRLPVRAYAASVASSTRSLHQIHAGCGERIEQRRTCPIHGQLETAEIGRAYDYAPQQPVVLTSEELATLQPATDPTLRIEHVLPGARLDLAMLAGRTLHLVPANPVAAADYATWVQVLQKADVWAVGTGLLSERRQLAGLHAVHDRLVLHVFHWPACLRSAPEVAPGFAPLNRTQVSRLEQSLAQLRKPLSWTEYRDEYEAQLEQLVARKMAAAAKPQVKTRKSLPKSPRIATPAVTARSRRSKAA